MSSTDADPVAALFTERLVPAAEALRARGASSFALGPDPEADSYFTPCADPGDPFGQFDLEHIQAWLERHWRDRDLPELVELIAPLFELAAALDHDVEQSDEVAPDLYVMF